MRNSYFIVHNWGKDPPGTRGKDGLTPPPQKKGRVESSVALPKSVKVHSGDKTRSEGISSLATGFMYQSVLHQGLCAS